MLLLLLLNQTLLLLNPSAASAAGSGRAGNAALWYLFNLVVSLNYGWLPLLRLTWFEFSVPVVAFDLRICLGACIVCLELLAKYLIRGPSIGGSRRTSSPVVCVFTPQAPFSCFFFSLFLNIFRNNLSSRRGKKKEHRCQHRTAAASDWGGGGVGGLRKEIWTNNSAHSAVMQQYITPDSVRLAVIVSYFVRRLCLVIQFVSSLYLSTSLYLATSFHSLSALGCQIKETYDNLLARSPSTGFYCS